jgi:RimJ/RimL family protein N-acetyltransferase
LLQHHITAGTELEELFIITSADNIASRRIAERSGFAHVGSPWEDLNGILLAWKNPERPH